MLKMTEASQLGEMKSKLGVAEQLEATAENRAKAQTTRADTAEAKLQYAIHTTQQLLAEKQSELDHLKKQVENEAKYSNY